MEVGSSAPTSRLFDLVVSLTVIRIGLDATASHVRLPRVGLTFEPTALVGRQSIETPTQPSHRGDSCADFAIADDVRMLRPLADAFLCTTNCTGPPQRITLRITFAREWGRSYYDDAQPEVAFQPRDALA